MNNNQVQSFLPLQYKGLTKELRYKAEKELHETEEARKKGLEHLREFIEDENLPEKLDDDILLWVLRAAKFDKKESRRRLKNYCYLRGQKDFVELFNEEKIMKIIDSNILGLLPDRDANGAAIMYSIAGIWNSELCDEKNLAAGHYALGQYALSFPATTISGLNYIINAQTEYTRRTLIDINMYKNQTFNMLCLPVRLKNVVVVRANAFIRFCYSAIRHFLPSKVTQRLHLQKETEISPNVLPPSILPSEFGGTTGPVSNAFFRDDFEKYLRKLKEQDHLFMDPDDDE